MALVLPAAVQSPRALGTHGAMVFSMKRSRPRHSPKLHRRKIDLLDVQTKLELAAGGVFTAVLLRWVM